MSDSSMSYEPEEEEEGEEQEEDTTQHGNPSGASGHSVPPHQNVLHDSKPLHNGTSHGNVSQRHKRQRLKPRRLALRAAATLPVGKYSDLYKEVVDDMLGGPEYGDGPRLFGTQYGIISWSPQEKNAFFTALARKGKDAIPEIAAFIGTKSQMEVRHYLDLLHRNFELHNVTEETVKNITLSDVPAAYEVSKECCLALENVASALSLRDEQAHNVAGRRKHGDFWLIDNEVAAYVEEVLEPEEESESEKDPEPESLEPGVIPASEFEVELQPETESKSLAEGDRNGQVNTVKMHSISATAKLLKISNWIRLSERVFMNAGERRLEDNWTQICFEDETPALTCDAFSDFYALTISITRRIVHSSIFFALSRIRAIERSHVNPKKVVKKEDIFAALDILKMEPNSRKFWASAPRRCALDIRHDSGENYKTVLLSYDELDALLGPKSDIDPEYIKTAPQAMSSASEGSSYSGEGFESDTSGRIPSTAQDSMDAEDDLSDAQEKHANALDQEASRAEESKLWRWIGKPDPQSLDHNVKPEVKEEEIEHTLFAKRKMPQEISNWRSRILYQAEWETFGQSTVAIDEEMGGNGSRKRLKID
ncbi:uncharacterized protein CIMG_05262 [Coccidioides immitis RS]|uniref:Myb-like domain-containing protein n=2 Tax=Coccidioides TaxID=5500 RepID=A0A0E1RXM9_COCIM|nr:uncharacterized protein CIMG_05262 [Coccidioides immitis RS]XP_003067561.1 hypothetical protein CPC735_065160 [Coccidioides posadasii C735 delta SOWgp]EAS34238.2 hypothetical protein CIMG_05262 [Coccidioides immitis RS]EER25416.1 hypothetical protein CPC735_065160 [Coccidioides posadasii C735 delta SOWgp]|eukprot:XP_003067561.1 hypothetical protein CPC735_065160 [Coccidioides posadasii C735 delta SOWgp]